MTDATRATIRLHHGTDENSANDILQNGLDASKAGKYNVSGEFWATTKHSFADMFAKANPAHGDPVCFEFELDKTILADLILQQLAYYESDMYEFLVGSFSQLNLHMQNKQIVPFT